MSITPKYGRKVNRTCLIGAILIADRVKKVVSGFDGFDLVHRVVEPLEEALNPAYSKEYFDKLRELRPQRALGHHAAPKRQRDDQKRRAR
jgi:hypothetical protein